MTNSHSTDPTTPNHTADQRLTPSLFEQIQSLFLLKNTPLHTLYTQFQLSLSVLFSILHDHTTQTLRRAIDEHTYLCAQRAHLELILETENVAIALAKAENPTQEQRRRLGTLNATLKTSFKHLQQLRDTLLNDDHTDLGEPHTTHKPTHTKRTTPRRAPTNTNANTYTSPHTTSSPTQPTPTPTHTKTNPTHTAETHTHTAPTPPTTPTPHLQTPSDPRWLPILPLLTPEEQHFITVLEPDLVETMLSYPPDYIVTNLRNALALNPDALASAVELTQTQ